MENVQFQNSYCESDNRNTRNEIPSGNDLDRIPRVHSDGKEFLESVSFFSFFLEF
jgi:hypothetical protein